MSMAQNIPVSPSRTGYKLRTGESWDGCVNAHAELKQVTRARNKHFTSSRILGQTVFSCRHGNKAEMIPAKRDHTFSLSCP